MSTSSSRFTFDQARVVGDLSVLFRLADVIKPRTEKSLLAIALKAGADTK